MSGLESLLNGRTLAGRYRIEEVIGRGGMGAVYAATDERLGRRVAVKVITLAAEGEERERLHARFLREAQAAAGIHHPNVATVHDLATDPELELDFLVMELLHGEDLATRLERAGPPPLPLALRILHDAAAGLAAGHRIGLIHRDVKPANLFLAEGDEGELRVCVLDFGIARLVAEEAARTQLTTEGIGPLSPAYASPEQLRGERDLTPASDVYSLGLIGFELLTGGRLFSGDDLTRGATPIPPPKLRVLNPEVPPEVDEVLQRALAHEPAERFPDAGAFAVALEATGYGAAVPISPAAAAVAAPLVMDAPADAGPTAPPDETEAILHPAEETQFLAEPRDATATLLAPATSAGRGHGARGRRSLQLAPLLALLLLAGGLLAGTLWLAASGSSEDGVAEAAPVLVTAPEEETAAPAAEEAARAEETTRSPAAATAPPAPPIAREPAPPSRARQEAPRPQRRPAASRDDDDDRPGKGRGRERGGGGKGKAKKP